MLNGGCCVCSAAAAQRVPESWFQCHADVHFLRKRWQTREQGPDSELHREFVFMCSCSELSSSMQRGLNGLKTWKLNWFISGLKKYFLSSTGTPNKRSSLWPGQRGGQWGWRSGGRWSLSDPGIPQRQDRGGGQGHLHETDRCLCPEKCRLLDCRGKLKHFLLET